MGCRTGRNGRTRRGKDDDAVPTGANAMEIERHLSSVPHRAGSVADHATALYVQQPPATRRFRDAHPRVSSRVHRAAQQSLSLLAPRHIDFDLLEGMPGHHTKWELMAGPPFLEESGDGDVTGPVVYVNAASKDDLTEIDAQHVSLQGAIALVRLGAPGGGGFRNVNRSWIAYNELRKRGVAGILEFMEPATSGYGGGAMWPNGNYKNTNMAERMSGMSPRGFLCFRRAIRRWPDTPRSSVRRTRAGTKFRTRQFPS